MRARREDMRRAVRTCGAAYWARRSVQRVCAAPLVAPFAPRAATRHPPAIMAPLLLSLGGAAAAGAARAAAATWFLSRIVVWGVCMAVAWQRIIEAPNEEGEGGGGAAGGARGGGAPGVAAPALLTPAALAAHDKKAPRHDKRCPCVRAC